MKQKKNGIPETFPNSRIPTRYLLDYLKEGLTKNDFHYSYPWLKTKDVDHIEDLLLREFPQII